MYLLCLFMIDIPCGDPVIGPSLLLYGGCSGGRSYVSIAASLESFLLKLKRSLNCKDCLIQYHKADLWG
jgi:hypothetical protein